MNKYYLPYVPVGYSLFHTAVLRYGAGLSVVINLWYSVTDELPSFKNSYKLGLKL